MWQRTMHKGDGFVVDAIDVMDQYYSFKLEAIGQACTEELNSQLKCLEQASATSFVWQCLL